MFLNTSYEVIATGLEAAFIAQLLKFIGYTIKHRKVNFQVLATTGGMPSSHTAGVIALSTTVGFICGFDQIEFAIALPPMIPVETMPSTIPNALVVLLFTFNFSIIPKAIPAPTLQRKIFAKY